MSVTDLRRSNRFRVRQKVVPLSGAGQSGPRDLCPHRGRNLQAIAFHEMLVAQD